MGVWSRPRWATVLAAVVLSAVASGWPGTSAGLATALAADTTAGTVQSPVRARLRETSARAAALESIRTKDLQRHAAFLADDSLEGREGGSRGGHAAGLYLAREFHRLGLAGGNGNSYIQGFESNQRNILAKIEGEDEQLKDEYIVLSAHYDHVGYGTPQNSYGPTGRIHNGADDNASGTAALLEIAEAFKEAGLRPRRSILFALWDGEEKGLLGSLHWVRNPTVPLNRVRLVINMDMIGRLRNDRLEVYGVRTAPGLRLLLAQQNTENLLLTFNWKMKADSDHHPFFERGVPVIMLHTGLHEQYHRPSDDVELLNLEGMHRVSRLALRLLDTAANADGLPGFRNQSTRETEEMQQASERPLEPARPRLGVTWDVGETGAEGLRVLRVHRGSAAEKSGLREGDRVLEFGGVKVDRFETLRRLVLQAQSPVRVKVQRPEEAQPRVLMVELEGPAVRVGLSWRVDDAEPRCVIVNRVLAGSPAEEAGLQVNDRIHEVSGRTFATSEEFLQLVNEVDSSLTLLVEREGRLREVRLERLAPLVAE